MDNGLLLERRLEELEAGLAPRPNGHARQEERP